MKSIKHNKHFFILVSFLFIISCEVDRSTIGVEDQPQYSYNYINDYDYDHSRYFFIDTYYFNRYEKGFSEDLQMWSYEEGTSIRELNVYKSASFSNNKARRGVATIPSRIEEFNNMLNLEGVSTKSGEVELAEFVPLEEGKDYEYDYARGYFYLTLKIRDANILAVAYRTDKDTVGTLQSKIMEDDTTQFYVLRLIKSQSMREFHSHVWPLMMKNVYFLGDTSFARDGFNLTIRKKDKQNTMQDVDPRKSFNHLLGLDLTDEDGNIVDNGNGQVDNNFYLVNLYEGILTFPGLHPFAPLPNSRFQIRDTNRVELYDIYIPGMRPIREWDGPSKFEIVVRYLEK